MEAHAKEPLQPPEGRFERVLETIADGIGIVDRRGYVTFANDAAKRMLGLGHDVVGRHVADLPVELVSVEGRRLSKKRALAEFIRKTGPGYGIEVRVERPDGRRIVLSVNRSVLCDAGRIPAELVVSFTDITDRKKAEDGVGESQERFRTLIESTSDWIWEVDARGAYTYASRKVEDLLGYTPEEVMGKTPFDFMPPEEANRVGDEFAGIVGAQRPFDRLENVNLRKDGRRVVLETSGVPVFDNEGNLVGYRGIDRDITERKRAEERLRAASMYARGLLEASIDPLVTISAQGKITDVNKATVDVTGVPREELIGSDFSSYFTEPQKAREGYEKVFAKGFVRDYSLAMRARSGQVTDVLYNASIFRNEAGKAQGVFAAARDVTKRRRAEEALKESEAKFRGFADNTAAAIFIYDSSGFRYGNPASQAITGYTPEDLVGMEFWRLVHPDEREMVKARGLSRLRGGKEPPRYEVKILTKQGAERWIDLTAGLITYEGRPAAIATAFDITDRIRREQTSSALDRINAAIHSTLNFDEIMDTVVAESVQAIGCESAAIILREGEDWVVRYTHGLPEEHLGLRISGAEAGQPASDMAAHEPAVIDDTYRDDRAGDHAMAKRGIRSQLSVPLVVKDSVVGALVHQYRSRATPFSRLQVDFAGKLASSVSLAFENARLYDEQRRISETLQQSFIQRVPEIKGLAIGVAYETAAEAEKVGGDFYDIFAIDKNLVAVLVGDVSGKGIGAAGLTETIRSSVRTLAYIDPSPSFVLRRMNESLLRQLTPGGFASAIFLTLDVRTEELWIANAGHPLPVLCGKERFFLALPTGGLLGAFPGVFQETYLKVGESPSIVLYTDGLVEARRDSELFGQDRLLDVLGGQAGLTLRESGAVETSSSSSESGCICSHAQTAADTLLRSARDFAGGELTDDIAIVVLHLTRRP